MDEVHAETRRVAAGDVGHVVAELVFFLIAQDGKGGDGRDKLVVAEGLESGNGLEVELNGKASAKPRLRVARFGVVQESAAGE